MAPRVLLIDSKWAEKLIGMRLCVPNHWWQGHKGRKLWNGEVVSFDVDLQKWNFVVDGDEAEQYAMNYNGLLEYIDVNNETNQQYNDDPNLFPPEPLRGHGEEELALREEGAITKYKKTDPEEWKKLAHNDKGRAIEPIPWTGDNEELSVKATPEELDEFEDETGEIKFSRVFEWLLPLFDHDETPLFEWQAARMRSYMAKIINDPAIKYKPRYYVILLLAK